VASNQLSKTERVLRIFTEVRPGEGPTALLMFANVFLILCAYYFIKPLREGWLSISSVEGLKPIQLKAYSSFAQALLLLPIVGWYGQLAVRWGRTPLFTRATLFCVSNMLLFFFLQPDLFFGKLPWSGILFYLWVGIFGVFVVAQFWTFCADIYSDERGKRMMPMIAIGATSGAAASSWIVGALTKVDEVTGTAPVPNEYLLLVASVPLLVSILITRIVDARERDAGAAAEVAQAPPPPAGEAEEKAEGLQFLLSGARLVFVSRFILAAAVVTILLNWVNTNGENLLYAVVNDSLASQVAEQGIVGQQAIDDFVKGGTTAFYGNFFFWVNVVALALQSLVASRLLKYGGFGPLLMILPVIALISYTTMALLPVLAIVKLMKIAENATDYSLNNTARHVLWLPVSSEMKFRGKPAIDTLYVRMGDGLAALTVMIGVGWLQLETGVFFVFNVVLVLAWIGFAVVLIREHRKASEAISSDGAE
jgi:AAA family ATP:ADP antiporter